MRIKKFPICVVSFIAKSDAEQREQFILVNSTKPLPKGLIYELLPSTNALLPTFLERRRFSATVLERLNHDIDSPFEKLIRTPTNGDGVVADNSILKMLENSLTDGVLYRFNDDELEDRGAEKMLGVLKAFWGAVEEVFPNAWGKPPRHSRLMHGAGIVGMGFVMDAIADRHRKKRRIDDKPFEIGCESVCRSHYSTRDEFGASVALDGNRVSIGAFHDETKVKRRRPGTFIHLGPGAGPFAVHHHHGDARCVEV